MDRVLSLFGLYDVLGYLLSGLTLLLGSWWVLAGSLPGPSAVGVFGFLGAGYAIGQVTAVVGRAWESLWWQTHGGKPEKRMIEEDEKFGFQEDLRVSICRQIETEVGISNLTAVELFKLARAKLRLEGFEARAETMRAMHGLCRNLTASVTVVTLVAVGGVFGSGWDPRLLATAALGFAVAPLFAYRTLRFSRRCGREIWFSYLALRMKRDAS